MPYPQEHSCRLENPDKYDRFARKNCYQKHDGKCIDFIFGVKEGKSEVQAMRYDKDVWTEDAARKHCKDHDGFFEAAKKESQHPHGAHVCVCPECGEEITVEEDVKCNTQKCPECGARMRAKETGERRQSMDNIERKSISVELKDEQEGSFVARIATLNVRDKDNDITIPGAFKKKTVLVSAYMHGSWMGKLPVGKATIRENGNEVIAEGQFNLKTTEGRDTYEAIKFAPELQEWSYGFYPIEHEEGTGDDEGTRILKKVDVKEISPVLVGAGVNTGVLAIKNKLEGVTYIEQAEAALAAVDDLVIRTKELASLRRKEGRVLSTQNRERMKKLLNSLSEVAADLKELLEVTEPKDDKALCQAILLFSKIKRELSEVT